MNLAGIKQIETALSIGLPPHYVELVTNYPSELLATDAPDFALLDDPATVIDENLAVRGKPFYGGVWPDNLIVIGTNGCGDLYVTRLDEKGFSVGFFDHEKPAFFPHSNSKAQLIEKLLAESNAC
ncbi:MAG: hypothetical protein EAZ11_09405 [Curvibacter sp.]|nr:MAG: hypothetical protein EAZ11_09405 [Curvibacter sp.]